MKTLILILTISVFSLGSFAKDATLYKKGKKNAYNAKKQVLEELAVLKIDGTRIVAMDALVKTAIQALRENGFEKEATKYEQEWTQQMNLMRGGISVDDLGDHRPLSQWLSEFYTKLETILGTDIMHALKLDDIKIFNFGPVVVYQPRGDKKTGDKWDKGEYQKHFVPYAAASVYWTSKIACDAAASGMIGHFCGIIATTLRRVTEKYAAPPLSDIVYDKFSTH